MRNQDLKSGVSFFPVPLPDELLDSLVYRYHHLSGAPNAKVTLEMLFGKAATVVPKLLANRLDIFWERAARNQFQNADELINRLTLLPAFGAILDRNQMWAARFASHGGFNLGTATLYRSPIHVAEPELQSCPMCVNEEYERLGVAYWHRSHQLDGVKVCHCHGCDLHSVCHHCHHPIRRPRSMDLPQPCCPSCKKPQFAVFNYPEPVKRLAILANQALDGLVPFCDRRLLARRIRGLVGEDTADACDLMKERYGSKYMNRFPDCIYSFHGDWLEFGFRFRKSVGCTKYDFVSVPSFGHMLMIVDFLFESWDLFAATNDCHSRAA